MSPFATPADSLPARRRRWSLSQQGVFRGSLRRSLGAWLLYVVVFEDALFGSGRMLEIGPLTVKMILFVLTLLYAAWSMFSLDRLRRSTVLLTTSFAALLCVEIVNGLSHAADLSMLGNDLSPLLSFLTFPFFELTIRTNDQLVRVIRIIVFAALIMMAGYTAIVLSVSLGIVPFKVLHDWIQITGGDDFVFESTGSIFYKGAIFIGIALFFCAFMKSWWGKALAVVFFLGLFMVGSRGLFSAFALTAFLYALVGPLSATKKLIFGAALLLLAAIALPAIFSLSGDKTGSNTIRINTLNQVADRVSPASAIFGHGFGIGVPERPEHMEISYVEIFHKQGVIGLFWWASLVAVLVMRFIKARAGTSRSLAYPLFLSAAFVLFESATNPFVNNPIGMYPVIICMVGLGVIAPSRRPSLARRPQLEANGS